MINPKMVNPLLPPRGGRRDPLGETLRQVVEQTKREGRHKVPNKLRECRLRCDMAFGEPLASADQDYLLAKRSMRRGIVPRYFAWAVRELVDIARHFWAPSREIAQEHVAAFLDISFHTVKRLDKKKRLRPPPESSVVERIDLSSPRGRQLERGLAAIRSQLIEEKLPPRR